jgi:hypothetical protein
MRVFILILVLVTLKNATAIDLRTVTAPDAHGDSVDEVISDLNVSDSIKESISNCIEDADNESEAAGACIEYNTTLED